MQWSCVFFFTVLVVSAKALKNTTGDDTRQGRISLFTIVNFANDQCTAKSDSTMYGTCLTQSECNAISGGAADGNCAAGFGVCCVVTIDTCGSTVAQNCSYITNPGYPTGYSTTGTCAFTVSRSASNICQLRLDFDNFVVHAPSTSGSCAPTGQDQVTFTSSTSQIIPTLCGTNTGQHIYMETGGSGSLGVVSFDIGSNSVSRTWKIKVTQVECGNDLRAPNSCLKYHQGVTGTINSFNRAGGQQLADVQMSHCIRQEEGYCSITYSAVTFDMAVAAGAAGAGTGTTACASNSLTIYQTATTSQGVYCGANFNNVATTTANGHVQSEITPFTVTYDTPNAVVDLRGEAGYQLRWNQNAC